MRLTDLTAIGRTIDLRYPTNRAIAFLAGGTAVVGAVVQPFITGHGQGGASPQGWTPAIGWGLGAGLAVFLAWALARELDPDHDLAAFAGAGLVLLSLFFLELPDLLPLFWFLVLARIQNRIVGIPARVPDSFLLLGLGSWLTWQGNWVYGMTTTIVFLLDGLMSQPLRRHLFFAAAALAITAGVSLLQDSLPATSGVPSAPSPVVSWPLWPLLLVSSLLFLQVVRAARVLRCVCDATGKPADPRRVQAAQILVLLTALQIAWWEGVRGVISVLPLWAAILGSGVYFALTHLLFRRAPGYDDPSPLD